MKIINLRRLIAASLVALGAFAFIACSVEASVNDGATAEVRLSKGYKEAPKESSGNGETGEYAFFTGCFIWSAAGSEAIKLTFDDTSISAYAPSGCGGWGGFGLGQINENGTAFNASSDLSTLKTVEFDVVAGIETTCKIQIGDDAEQELEVKTTKTHKTISFNKTGYSNYILIINGMNVFDSESKKLQITNLVFKDSAGNQITEFGTGEVIPEKN